MKGLTCGAQRDLFGVKGQAVHRRNIFEKGPATMSPLQHSSRLSPDRRTEHLLLRKLSEIISALQRDFTKERKHCMVELLGLL